MRIELKGQGEPIPSIALPHDVGEGGLPAQALLLPNGVPFLKAPYVEQGYTHFEVWCVGASGGKGSDDYSAGSEFSRLSEGGGGGGGGLHRVEGVLADLPDESAVVVGVVGANGPDGGNDLVGAVVGQDGGYSSFAGAVCRASGGKGGGIPYARPNGEILAGDGGQGGAGDRIVAGGGAAGGIFRYGLNEQANDYVVASTPATKGTWDGNVGQGGGGGEGGVLVPPRGWMGGFTIPGATYSAGPGGHGSYSFIDTSVYGSGGLPQMRMSGGKSHLIVAGGGGGARINTLLPYGSKAQGYNPNGAVYIRIFQIV